MGRQQKAIRLFGEHERIERHLAEVILPFWFEHGPDREYGGFYTCFDGITHERIATHKFLWAQGRMLWLLAELFAYAERRPAVAAGQDLRALASGTCSFIRRHGIDRDGHAYFVLTREGRPATLRSLALGENDELLASTYSDCFVVMGLSAFARVFRSTESLVTAASVLSATIVRFESGRFQAYPYPQPKGLTAHGSLMILSMAAGEFLDACASLGRDPNELTVSPSAAEDLHDLSVDPLLFMKRSFADLRRRFRAAHGLFRELAPRAPPSSILVRYANPGHTLETYALLLDRSAVAERSGWRLSELSRGVEAALTRGWDKRCGGLLTFILPGASPEQLESYDYDADPLHDEPLLETVRRDWPLKLWWPHVEGMYAALAVGLATRSERLLEWYRTLRDYSFGTFPHPEGREWIQIRDRFGNPKRTVVALPVKDPYHIPRCLLKILRVLEAHGADSAF